MKIDPYQRFEEHELILRDQLAIDRTVLANERTVLAYVRTALTLVIAGMTFLHFFPGGLLFLAGLLFVPAGFGVAILGYLRFAQMKRSIDRASQRRVPPPAEKD